MNRIKEGSLCKTLLVEGKQFDIRYGYHSPAEREHWEPAPIYPNFLREPVYSSRGWPFATANQDICPHYLPKPSVSGEDWCNDCSFYCAGQDLIGTCRCPQRKIVTQMLPAQPDNEERSKQ